jgi:hypothetical protein
MRGKQVIVKTTPGRKTRRLRNALYIFFLIGLAAAAPLFGQQGIEQRKIEYLISSIADLHGARFIRNGTEYDSQRAADHLRVKLHYASGRVNTAEDFIVYCATGSSMTGGAYQIKFADGHIVAVAVFLRNRLATYSAQEQNGSGRTGSVPLTGDQ